MISFNNKDYNKKSGNLLTKTITNMTTGATIKTDTYQYFSPNLEDRLTSYNGNSITYDEIELLGLKYNNIYYYIKNLQGDIIGILDSNYNQIASYEYNNWGKVLSIKDSQGNEITDSTNIGNINPFRYRGYYYDTETELYYLNSRYYNPEWCRFINADSYGGELGGNILSHNLYIYALNNPIMNCDNNGGFALIFTSVVKFVTTVVALAVSYYAAKQIAPVIAPIVTNVLSNPIYSPPKIDVKEKEKTKAKVQVKPMAPYMPKEEKNRPCTTATFTNDKRDVIRGYRLTIDESYKHVALGGNVMCDDKASALRVAENFIGFYEPESDKYKKPGYTYYEHYHPDGFTHRHIWFYPPIRR